MEKSWTIKVAKHINNSKTDIYDIIFSFINSGDYAPVMVGQWLKEQLNCRYFVYSVDPVPMPVEWHGSFAKKIPFFSKLIFNRQKCFLQKNMSNIDAFFGTNEQMLQFSLTNLNLCVPVIFDVICFITCG